MQRRNFISRLLPFNKSIVDIGCGEGFYALAYAGKIEDTYYAIDTNEELLESVMRKAGGKGIENIASFPSLQHFLELYNGEKVDVVLTEVIEHMSLEEAEELIQRVIGRIDFDHFIVTTPNADFNRYYELEGFRHEDHKWELGKTAFDQWLKKVLEGYAVTAERIDIGVCVDSNHTTQGAIVRKKEA